jgi:hypothetical protein
VTVQSSPSVSDAAYLVLKLPERTHCACVLAAVIGRLAMASVGDKKLKVRILSGLAILTRQTANRLVKPVSNTDFYVRSLSLVKGGGL